MTKPGARVRWGVLGAANIALKRVIPGMQKSERCSIAGIASRDMEKATRAAQSLGIPRAYGSYEELLADPEIDAIYNPLPNHLHVPWTIRAAEAGKHVLCEKPISLTLEEARTLIAVRDRTRVKLGEAFMVKSHPQWLRTREIVRSGTIGEPLSIVSLFTYFNRDPKNIRNVSAYGGGGVMDIGCYPISMSRFLFEREPLRAVSLLERDPDWGTDRLSSALLDFGVGHAVFTCSTQMVPYQTFQMLGSKGRVELEIPFNAPADSPTRLFIDDGSALAGANRQIEEFPVCDQYTLQGDAFAKAIEEDIEVPVPIENALGNMAVIEAVLRSADSRSWEEIA